MRRWLTWIGCKIRTLEMEGTVRRGPPNPFGAPLAFPMTKRFCAARLHGRGGRVTAQNGGFRPGQDAGMSNFEIYHHTFDPGTVCHPL